MASRDVQPNFRVQIECPCPNACGVGTPQARKFSDGSVHIRGCVKSGCLKCRGRNVKRSGGKGQRTAMNRAGVPKPSGISTGHEELAGGLIRFEIKSGAQVRPMVTAFEKGEAQSETARPIGDNRPFVFGAVPQADGKSVIYAFRTRSEDDLKTVIAAWAEQLGLLP